MIHFVGPQKEVLYLTWALFALLNKTKVHIPMSRRHLNNWRWNHNLTVWLDMNDLSYVHSTKITISPYSLQVLNCNSGCYPLQSLWSFAMWCLLWAKAKAKAKVSCNILGVRVLDVCIELYFYGSVLFNMMPEWLVKDVGDVLGTGLQHNSQRTVFSLASRTQTIFIFKRSRFSFRCNLLVLSELVWVLYLFRVNGFYVTFMFCERT